jgi:capsular polysaccharide transport system permease protein
MMAMRSPLSITLSVWQAVFLREAIDRLFDMRAAWFWLLMEPVLYILIIAFVWRAIRVHTMGGVDVAMWTTLGMLPFFLFRRTAVQVMYAAESNRPLFVYRQVKPVDTALARASLEAFLMTFVTAIILAIAGFLGREVRPIDPLLVASALLGLWLFALGYGLIASVLMVLVPETEHILKLVMMPLYFLSGTILPLTSVPQPYRDMLMFNPIAHGLELARLGFFPHYHTVSGVDMAYLYVWGIGSLLLGLMLYRRFARELVMQ